MKYDTILARSFSREEQRKLRFGAFVGCFIIVVSFCMVFKPYLKSPLIVPTLRLSMGMGFRLRMVKDTISPRSSTHPKEDADTQSNNEMELRMVKDTISPWSSPQPKEDADTPSNNEMELPKVKDTISPWSSPQSKDTRSNKEMELRMVKDTISPQSSSQPKDTRSNKEMELQMVKNKTSPRSSPQPKEDAVTQSNKEMEPLCKSSKQRSDTCDINGDTRIHGRSSTIFVNPSSSKIGFSAAANRSWTIQPYARKGDRTAMQDVTTFSVKLATDEHIQPPKCTVNHSVPAVVFSLRGYAGNHFHDFTDIVIPLYATSGRFNGEVQFLVTNKNPWWTHKFQAIIRKLSNYEVINIDEEDQTHCFPSMIVGLYKRRDELSIDPSRSPHSMRDFRDFLRRAYSLNKTTAIKIREGNRPRPRLLIISRQRSRTFTNEAKIAKIARRSGFTVIVAEATSNVSKFAESVNSCDVLMGVHGAGLTNMVFLPERAIVIQVVPLGAGWVANFDFGKPAAEMNLRYLEYKIREEESTLRQQYPHDHPVLREPFSITKLGWAAFSSVYLDKQNVKLDVARLRATLSEALQLLHQ